VPQGAPKEPAKSGLRINSFAMSSIAQDAAPVKFVPPTFPAGVSKAAMAMDDAGLASIYSYANLASSGMFFQGYPELAALAQLPEYRKISERLALQMTRKWIKLTAKGDDDGKKQAKLDELEGELERVKLKDSVRQAVQNDGFFGRCQIYIDLGSPKASGLHVYEDPLELAAPLLRTPAKIPKGSFKGLVVIEPLWSMPFNYNTTNPLAADFYKPKSWFVMGKEVHASRLLHFCSMPVPDLLKPSYAFGGLSMTQICKPYIDNWIRTRDSVSDLLHSFSTSGLKTNMESVISPDLEGGISGINDLNNRAEMFNRYRDNKGLLLLDKDNEEFFQFNVPLSGVPELQRQSAEMMAMPSSIPLVFLLGDSAEGLNASDDGAIRVFYDWIHSRQEGITDQVLDVIRIAQLNLWGAIDEDIGFEWEPLWQPSDKEISDINKSKADAAVAMISAGVISPEEERERLAADPLSGYNSIDVSDLPNLPGDDDETRDDDSEPSTGQEE
jgi:phage-related protein (TIGR01555 family)